MSGRPALPGLMPGNPSLRPPPPHATRSLLDHLMGDTIVGDLCCMAVGLTLVLWLRLSGAKVATTLWPPG